MTDERNRELRRRVTVGNRNSILMLMLTVTLVAVSNFSGNSNILLLAVFSGYTCFMAQLNSSVAEITREIEKRLDK